MGIILREVLKQLMCGEVCLKNKIIPKSHAPQKPKKNTPNPDNSNFWNLLPAIFIGDSLETDSHSVNPVKCFWGTEDRELFLFLMQDIADLGHINRTNSSI